MSSTYRPDIEQKKYITVDKAYDWMWQPELLLAAWMSASFMLLTLSLLFYHLTRVSSIEMSSMVAGVFSSILIIGALVLLVAALIPYWSRTVIALRMHMNKDGEVYQNENATRSIYICITIVLCIVYMFVLFL